MNLLQKYLQGMSNCFNPGALLSFVQKAVCVYVCVSACVYISITLILPWHDSHSHIHNMSHVD